MSTQDDYIPLTSTSTLDESLPALLTVTHLNSPSSSTAMLLTIKVVFPLEYSARKMTREPFLVQKTEGGGSPLTRQVKFKSFPATTVTFCGGLRTAAGTEQIKECLVSESYLCDHSEKKRKRTAPQKSTAY